MKFILLILIVYTGYCIVENKVLNYIMWAGVFVMMGISINILDGVMNNVIKDTGNLIVYSDLKEFMKLTPQELKFSLENIIYFTCLIMVIYLTIYSITFLFTSALNLFLKKEVKVRDMLLKRYNFYIATAILVIVLFSLWALFYIITNKLAIMLDSSTYDIVCLSIEKCKTSYNKTYGEVVALYNQYEIIKVYLEILITSITIPMGIGLLKIRIK